MQTALSQPTSSPATPNSLRITAPSHQPATPRLKASKRFRVDPPLAKTLPLTGSVEVAIEGNHLAIQGFLKRTIHRPSLVEFNSHCMRPGYDPSERLIVKSPADRRLAAHVQVVPQTIQFGRVDIPIARLRDLSVLPEFKQRGLDARLLVAAEQKAKHDGAMLIVAQCEDPQLLQGNGWSSLGTDPICMVSPQRLLGQLPGRAEPESPFYADQMPQDEVRIGRLTDAEVVQQMYQQQVARAYGTTVRSADYWPWLLAKHGHDRLYLYFEDSQPLGYVVVRGASVIELIDLSDDGRASARLLEHVGADAIEQGRHSLRIHAPLSDRVHQWADAAGGQLSVGLPDDAWMVKVPSIRTLLRRMAAELHRRCGKRKSMELSIRVGNEELLIRSGVRSMRITRDVSTQHRIGLTARGATQLMLGYRTAADLAAEKQLVASNPEAIKVATALFPAMELWRTRWDDVPALES